MIEKTFVETEKGLRARVTFALPESTWADSIYLVGDFNDWNYTSHPLGRGRDGAWSITLNLEVGRTYQFRYRRDGEWMNESQADAYVHNPYGSDNSIVSTDPNFKLHRD
jgi:1,4-alpha-glucan branching enzyme